MQQSESRRKREMQGHGMQKIVDHTLRVEMKICTESVREALQHKGTEKATYDDNQQETYTRHGATYAISTQTLRVFYISLGCRAEILRRILMLSK